VRLATCSIGGHEKLGLVREDAAVVDLGLALESAGETVQPRDMVELIEGTDRELLEKAASASRELPPYPPEAITWLPPVRRPAKIIGVVVNNRAVASAAAFIGDQPVVFFSPSSALVGHGQPIVIRPDYGLTHPEAELGVVVGRRLKDVTAAEAQAAVFGYTIVNDVTSVGLKSEDTIVFTRAGAGALSRADGNGPPPGFEHGDMQLTYHARSKGTDTFTPCGPWITTADEIPDPSKLAVRMWMGDELCTADEIGRLTHGVAEVLCHISRYVTLEAGDIVHMGTAITGKYKLREIDFQSWDGPCTIEIDGIGRLSNPIVRDDRSPAGAAQTSRSNATLVTRLPSPEEEVQV
jgi:2-keto-4-pentenoate hydratase/2-oxohepta-3-ene-1,7-dioic acid hydratase in catechol pathway